MGKPAQEQHRVVRVLPLGFTKLCRQAVAIVSRRAYPDSPCGITVHLCGQLGKMLRTIDAFAVCTI